MPQLSLLLLLLLLCCCACPSAASASADGFLGFFSTDCPSGWSAFTPLQGRLLLSVNDSFQAGNAVGFALSDGEDRQHAHTVSGSFSFSSKHVAALGGGNTASAHSGQQPLLPFLNLSLPSASGLPFLQLTACRFNVLSLQPAPSLPAGGISFWDPAATAAGCPEGSEPLQAAGGRLLALGASTGWALSNASEPLHPGQDVAHSHGFSASVSLGSTDLAGIDGCCE